MPLIRIENYPTIWFSHRSRDVALALQAACVAAQVPGIDSKKYVTVTFGGQQVLREDTTLVIIVEGLFDDPARTKDIRDRLARLLAEACREMIESHWKIEVLVKRFNPTVDSYVVLEPEPRGV